VSRTATDVPGDTDATAAQQAQRIEAILLTVDRPVAPDTLAMAIGIEEDGAGHVASLVEGLNGAYERTGRAFRIESVAGGYRLMTLSEHADVLAAFHRARASSRLSRAGLETLAIIAYRQPITRAQLEGIRGVASGEVLKTLMDRRLVTIKGRAEELGRPMLYGTTREFLDAFGLASVKDLPSVGELRGG
jgi:segregation and condensation protein B